MILPDESVPLDSNDKLLLEMGPMYPIGVAWRGVAWRGEARRGVARRVEAWRGVAYFACGLSPHEDSFNACVYSQFFNMQSGSMDPNLQL